MLAMNARQRKQLAKMSDEMLMICMSLETLKSKLETIQEDEQDKYDNMPESLQDSERGCAMYEGIESLEELVDRVDTLITELNDISEDTGALGE